MAEIQEENETNSMKKIFSEMGDYMIRKLKERIEKNKKMLDKVKGSHRKNKDEVTNKLKEVVKIMREILDITEAQLKNQPNLINLTERMSELDNELDDLLLEDGS